MTPIAVEGEASSMTGDVSLAAVVAHADVVCVLAADAASVEYFSDKRTKPSGGTTTAWGRRWRARVVEVLAGSPAPNVQIVEQLDDPRVMGFPDVTAAYFAALERIPTEEAMRLCRGFGDCRPDELAETYCISGSGRGLSLREEDWKRIQWHSSVRVECPTLDASREYANTFELACVREQLGPAIRGGKSEAAPTLRLFSIPQSVALDAKSGLTSAITVTRTNSGYTVPVSRCDLREIVCAVFPDGRIVRRRADAECWGNGRLEEARIRPEQVLELCLRIGQMHERPDANLRSLLRRIGPHSDYDRFTVSYCGTQMWVERLPGVFSLRVLAGRRFEPTADELRGDFAVDLAQLLEELAVEYRALSAADEQQLKLVYRKLEDAR